MIKIIENQSEIGAGTRGASLGVGALKVVSQNVMDGYFGKFDILKVEHENTLLDHPTRFQHAKRIDGLVKVYDRTISAIQNVYRANAFPLILSGDHGSAGGTIAGIKLTFPDQRIGVIWIDAHADIHTPYTTPSGNIHGMPLATALAEDNLHDQVNEVPTETQDYWNQLKHIGGISPKILAEDIVYISVRDTEQPEDDYMARHGIKNYSVEEVRSKGCDAIVAEIDEKLNKCDLIYVSFDVDSMDCILVSKGTGTPVENGLTPHEASQFMQKFAANNKVKCIEFVEINPCLDDKINTMAETAYSILKEVTTVLEKRL